ncbi:MAG: hypothetical protein Fur0025_21390 [Oscillatoriaceae cyanobacterium]
MQDLLGIEGVKTAANLGLTITDDLPILTGDWESVGTSNSNSFGSGIFSIRDGENDNLNVNLSGFDLAATIAATSPELAPPAGPGDPITGDVTTATSNLPLSFIANAGQAAENVQALVKGAGHTIFFTPEEISFQMAAGETSALVELTFPGANPSPIVAGKDLLPGVANFISGNNPSQWWTDVPTYESLVYQDLYPGIDLIYSGQEGQLKSDFILDPGVDYNQIRLNYSGIEGMRIGDDGSLILDTPGGELTESPPIAFQEIDNQRVLVDASYVLLNNTQVGFAVGDYNRAYPLIIDPTLAYSTYLGGSGADIGSGIAVDGDGNVYITGSTTSVDFPNQNPLPASITSDAFVTKLFKDGTRVMYSTYLGGVANDAGNGIAVDSDGNAYVAGVTASSNFPIQSPLQPEFGGNPDAFILKLNPNGNGIIYSTFLGGSGNDSASKIVLDGDENAYVVGTTTSSDFPITGNGLQQEFGGAIDAFVAKIDKSGTSLAYATYLGGRDDEEGGDIAVDASGNVYVTGTTFSVNFPTTEGVFQRVMKNINFRQSDGFVSKLNADGSGLVYSTYLGGSDDDKGNGIAVDSAGSAYITGSTGRLPVQVAFNPDGRPLPVFGDFPTQFPVQEDFSVIAGSFDTDGFVTKLSPDGSGLQYSTYLGGGFGIDTGMSIAVDAFGRAYVTGTTRSPDFPVAEAIQNTNKGEDDVFLTQFSPDGSTLEYSTFLGGAKTDTVGDMALDNNGHLYLVGSSSSSDFPTESEFQGSLGGLTDVFLAKIVPTGVRVFKGFESFVELIADAGRDPLSLFFDEGFYLANNPDVRASVAAGAFRNGLEHFNLVGQFERRQPSPLFNELLYLQANPDVAAAVANRTVSSGFTHFVQSGFFEGRDRRTQLFDENYYFDANPDMVAAVRGGAVKSGYEHFIRFGQSEGRAPNPLFDQRFYALANPSVAADIAAGRFRSAFDHFTTFGEREGRSPTAAYNQSFYLARNPDVVAAIAAGQYRSGYEHFLRVGQAEGRAGSPFFDEKFYLANNPDIAAAVAAGAYRSGFDHFMRFGQTEGRAPSGFYNETYYLTNNPDIAAAVRNGTFRSGFEHFAALGFAEGRLGISRN